MKKSVTLLLLLFSINIIFSQGVQMQNDDDAGKELRMMILTTNPDEIGLKKDKDFNNVYGVITDWVIGDQIASIVSLKDGNASLYTTSKFGIIGGQSHEKVRIAAIKYVSEAEKYYNSATEVKVFPYPKGNQVFYYLLTYDGVKLLIGNMNDLENNKDKTFSLFDAAQNVLTELREISEK